jgi:hypothetical protein
MTVVPTLGCLISPLFLMFLDLFGDESDDYAEKSNICYQPAASVQRKHGVSLKFTRILPLLKAFLAFEATNGIPPPLRTPSIVSNRLFVMIKRKLFACMLLTGWPRLTRA